jgi:carboxynorspermidine decarboxylase
VHPQNILEICHRNELPTPCYLIHLGLLDRNLRILQIVQDRTGARIILALKGFAAFSVFPQIRQVLCGTTASSINEARLGLEEFGREVHVYCVAYTPEEIAWLSTVATHITFNSLSQWQQLKTIALGADNVASYGLRINPEYSEIETDLYNPCRPGSRFGMTIGQLQDANLDGIDGLHFHTMCEQNADTLARTLDVVEDKFGGLLHQLRWLNFGGGHHITRPDYDVDLLCRCIQRMQEKYNVHVYLEPGEAIALNTGYLVTSVLDRFRSGDRHLAILDTSATAHMPDVLEMPYRPEILGAGLPGERAHTVNLGGLTCLAGDVIGDYSFDEPPEIGERLVFSDMAHYTMVKNTTFNGVNLPSIAVYDPKAGTIRVVRRFGYEDYRNRLS